MTVGNIKVVPDMDGRTQRGMIINDPGIGLGSSNAPIGLGLCKAGRVGGGMDHLPVAPSADLCFDPGDQGHRGPPSVIPERGVESLAIHGVIECRIPLMPDDPSATRLCAQVGLASGLCQVPFAILPHAYGKGMDLSRIREDTKPVFRDIDVQSQGFKLPPQEFLLCTVREHDLVSLREGNQFALIINK